MFTGKYSNRWLDLYHGPDTGDFYWRIDGRDVPPGFAEIVIDSPQFADTVNKRTNQFGQYSRS